MTRRTLLGSLLAATAMLALLALLAGRRRSLPADPDPSRTSPRRVPATERGTRESGSAGPPSSGGTQEVSEPTLWGFVIDDLTGGRIPEVQVTAFSRSERGAGAPVAHAVSDAGGRYELRLPDGGFALQARLLDEDLADGAVGITPADGVPVQVPEGRGPVQQDLHIELHPKVVVEGRVLDARTSVPLAGAQVLLSFDRDSGGERFRQPGLQGGRTGKGPPRPEWFDRVREFISLKKAKTSEDGSFRLVARFHPGVWELSASHPEYEAYFGGEHETGKLRILTGPGQRHFLEIKLSREVFTRIKGRITSRSGEPVAGARVQVRDAPFWREATTDAQGNYQCDVTSAGVKLIVRHADYRTAAFKLEDFSPGGVVEDAPRILDRKELKVHVSAVDETGSPVSAKELLLAEHDPPPGEKEATNPFFGVVLGGDGAGAFHADPGRKFSFHLGGDSPFEVASVEDSDGVRQGRELRFDQPGARIRVVLKRR